MFTVFDAEKGTKLKKTVIRAKKCTLYPKSGRALLSQCDGTLSAVEELCATEEVLQERRNI